MEPAVAQLARELVNSNGTPMSRLRAIENIDRAGYPRGAVVSNPEEARASSWTASGS